MDSNQNILKYKKYCIISNCEKNASFNYIELGYRKIQLFIM